ncbi:type I restriction-modification system subunit M N-terminal domain-containing protein [Desulfosporosinus meridiei]|uniref:site-specific DNA-methyltransferase (adenine-specific) n=1 Tax=Desulfosporosinus meridiei (strain ATCC BAA-275 / DSM 13257 / KCTC 12902 / NCIMB 13706 / S10) TaxID=768704 RepID=J7IUM3_DESMD|nr:type I restriction-modification system subunit M N-terminal domain-containing protein [Desulfosporosinus meridiei]AFQ42793.1 type I restriction-modification system methyltransferase subunit [Desulfosporosinus meridiei DSM 13257]
MSDKLSLDQLEKFIDETCDFLRGDKDAEEFEEYVLAILFLKRLNDRFNLDREIRREKLVLKGLSESQISKDLEQRESYRLFVPTMARWDVVKQEKQDLGSYLMKAFAEIDDKNRGCLGLLNTIDFMKTTETGERYMTNAILAELMRRFEEINLADDHLAF